MKKVFFYMFLLVGLHSFAQTRNVTEVVIGKVKMQFGTTIPKTNVLGFETYDLTGLSAPTYTFGTGSGGFVPNWVNLGPNYTLNVPLSSTAGVISGLLSNADYLAFKNQRWSTLGNSGTLQTTNFLGTTDNVGLSFRTNNTIRATISNAGNFGIGTISPAVRFEVASGVANTSGMRFTNLNSVSPTGPGQPLGVNISGDIVTVAPAVPISGLTSATAFNSINNANFAQLWNWNTLSNTDALTLSANALTNGTILRISTNSSLIASTTGLLTVENTTPLTSGVLAAFKANSSGSAGVYIMTSGFTGFGTATPTSTVQSAGSFAVGVLTTATSTTLTGTSSKIILNNAALNITITLPNAASCIGRTYSFTRAATSTGTVTVTPLAGQIQSLAGTMGATTSIGAHSATGGGVDIQFWSDGTNWYR